MKRFVIPLFILLLVGLQNSIFEHLRVLGVKPDIVLTFLVCHTLLRGNPEGTIAGVLGGILEDVFSGIAFGINSIGCMITTFLIGSVVDRIYKDNIFVPGLFTFFGTVIKELIVFLFLYLTRENRNIAVDITGIILPEAIYNTVLAVFFFKLIAKLSNKFFISKPGSFNT